MPMPIKPLSLKPKMRLKLDGVVAAGVDVGVDAARVVIVVDVIVVDDSLSLKPKMKVKLEAAAVAALEEGVVAASAKRSRK